MNNNIEFEWCRWDDHSSRKAFTELLNHYMEDPMGDYPPLDASQQDALTTALSQHPTAEVLLIKSENQYVGMSTVFTNFSTFKIKPYLYIHDVVVLKEFRGKGYGKMLMEELIRVSAERGYCKLTLEVREDNPAAQQVYRSLGFEECDPRMFFWTKML